MMMVNIFRMHRKLTVISVALVVAIAGIVAYRIQQSSKSPIVHEVDYASTIKARRVQPYSAIDKSDASKQTEFLNRAVVNYPISLRPTQQEPTPELVVNACMAKETAEFQMFIRSDAGRAQSPKASKKALAAIKEFCYKTYSVDGQVPPEQPMKDKKHVH